MKGLFKFFCLCIITGTLSITGVDARAGNTNLTINYDDSFAKCVDAESLEIDLTDIRVPGDSHTELVTFTNVHKHDIELYFSAEKLEEIEGVYDLDITIDENLIDLSGVDENEYISIGTIKKGQSVKLVFNVSIPKENNNDYVFSDGKYIYRLGVMHQCPPDEFPSVGIYNNPIYIIPLGISCICAFMLIAKENRKGKERKDENQ